MRGWHDWRLNAEAVCYLVLSAGEALLVNGAETYRVEETMELIGEACGASEVGSFVTATGIFVSVTDGSGSVVSRIRRVRGLMTDLAKVSEINSISRQLAGGTISPDDALAQLGSLGTKPPAYSESTKALSSGIGSAAFALLAGGGPADVLPAFLGGIFVNYTVRKMSGLVGTRLLAVMIGGLAAAAVGTSAHSLFPVVLTGKVIVGSIMVLVPGVALTNAIRDVMSGELVAGGSRFLEALATAVSIAVGAAFWLSIWKAVAIA